MDICEAYFHLSPFEVDYDSLPKLGQALSQIARDRAESTFQFETTLEIALAPGTLKGWITVGAAILYGVYQGVSQYPDFKKGIHELSTDTKSYAQEVNNAFFRNVNVAPEQIYRMERRTKSDYGDSAFN